MSRATEATSGPRRPTAAAAIAGGLTLTLGVAVCGGWTFDLDWLKAPVTGAVSMKVNTALGFVLIGLALCIRPGARVREGLLAALTAWGALHLTQDAFGWRLGIDQLFAADPGLEQTTTPGRMAPTTALSFVLLGVAALAGRRKWSGLHQATAFIAGVIALLSIVGYVYDAEGVYRLQGHTAMALHTGLGLFAAAGGVLLCHADSGATRLLGTRSPSGVVLRSALPAAVLIPLLAGWLSIIGIREAWWSTGFGFSVTAVLSASAMVMALAAVSRRARTTEATLVLRDRALDSTQVGVLIADATLDDLPIVEVNAAFERLTGYSHEEMLGKNCRFLNRRARDQPELDVVRTALREHEDCDVVLVNHRKDGSEFQNHLTIAPVMNERGAITHFVGVTRDVSDDVARQRKLAELLWTAKRDRRTAERALAARDEFLAMISHELRSPLHTARLWASLLTEQGSRVAPAEVARHLIQSIDAQARLVGDLLDVSRFSDEAQLDLDLQVLDLGALLQRTAETLTPAAQQKGVELTVDRVAGPADPILVNVDPDRLSQVATNLVENAVKFTPAGGSVRIRFDRADGHAIIEISDTGCGIREEDRERVFDRFWQGTARTQGGGLGLGLSIVKHLVEAHGGEISVHSKGQGHGATFRIDLPLAEPASRPGLPTSPATMETGQRALVVDEDANARLALASILRAHGWDVRTARSAEDAVAQLAVRRVSLLITELSLSPSSGLQMLQALRADASFGAGPIAIATSGRGVPHDKRQALAAGFDGYLAKPMTTETLLELVSVAGSKRSEALRSDRQ